MLKGAVLIPESLCSHWTMQKSLTVSATDILHQSGYEDLRLVTMIVALI